MSRAHSRSAAKRQKHRERSRYLNAAPKDGSNVHYLDTYRTPKGVDLALTIVLNLCHEAVLNDNRRFVVLNAGRGFGKTQLILAKIWKHISKPYTDAYGVPLKHKVWYIAPTITQGKKIFWQRLKDFFGPLIKDKNETDRTIVLVNGAEITIVGSEQYDSLRGPYLTMAIFDEFAFHAQNYWMRVIRPMLSRVKPLGEAFFCSTPDGENEFHELFQRGEDKTKKRWASYHFTSLEGGFIPESEIEEAKHEMTYEEWRQEYFGEFIATAGRVYHSFNKERNCKMVQHVPGLDIHMFWDFNEVPACHMGLAHVYKGKVYVFDEICIGKTEANMDEFLKRYTKDNLIDPDTGKMPKIYVYGDVSGDRETSGVSDYMTVEHILAEAGYPRPQIKVTTTNPFEKDRVNSVNVKLHNAAGIVGIIINSKKCPKLVKDLMQVKRAENGKIDKVKDRKLTHISDALGYMIWVLFPMKSPSTKVLEGRRRKPESHNGYWVSSGTG
jgi:hypothetical protein